MTEEEAPQDIKVPLAWSPIVVDQAEFESARRIEGRFQASWWDGLIVGTAHKVPARYSLSEDLQAGIDLDGI